MCQVTLQIWLSYCVKPRFDNLSVILDNNSTHKKKMQFQLQAHLFFLGIQDKIEVEFIYTPPYSPNFNLAEYLIHLLRLKLLHHLPSYVNIQQVRSRLENYFSHSQLQTPEQIQNTLQHIYNLVD